MLNQKEENAVREKICSICNLHVGIYEREAERDEHQTHRDVCQSVYDVC